MAEGFGKFVGEAYAAIARLAEVRPSARWDEPDDSQKLALGSVKRAASQQPQATDDVPHQDSFTAVWARSVEELGIALDDLRTAVGEMFPDLKDESSHSPGAIADDRDEMPTPEEWRKLKAEWTHDYGLRRLEDRGVKYEDDVERKLDPAATRSNSEGQQEQRPPLPRPHCRGPGRAGDRWGKGPDRGRGR